MEIHLYDLLFVICSYGGHFVTRNTIELREENEMHKHYFKNIEQLTLILIPFELFLQW